MTRSLPSLSADLDRVGSGDISPAEARPIVQAALRASDVDHSSRVYASFRNLTWKLLTAREFGGTVAGWYDLIKTASSTTRKTDRVSTADKLVVLADLLSQSGRFEELQSPDQVLQRKHVKRLLALLADAGGEASRSNMSQSLGLADANLSRILTTLRSNGFVSREMDGKEASFKLTEVGWNATGGMKQSRMVPLDSLPIAVAMSRRGQSEVARNQAFDRLVAEQGLGHIEQLPRDQWLDACEALATERLPVADSPWREFVFGGSRAFRCTMSTDTDYDVFAVLDLSDHRQTEELLRHRIDGLRSEVVDLQKRLTDADSRFFVWGNAMRDAREAVLFSSAAAWKNALAHVDASVVGTSWAPPTAGLLAQAKAFNHTVGSLLFAPDPDTMDMVPAVDVRSTIEDSLECYRAVLHTKIDVKYGALKNAMARGSFEPAMTRFVYACSKFYGEKDALSLDANLVNKKLVLTMKSHRSNLQHEAIGVMGRIETPALLLRSIEGFYGELGMEFEVHEGDGDHVAQLEVPVTIPQSRRTKVRRLRSAS